MGFDVSYSAGGVIDEVKKMSLPEHVSPDVNKVCSKGFRLEALDSTPVSFTKIFDKDVYLSELEITCEEYNDLDYWELSIGEEKLCETMYTQQMPSETSIGYDFTIYPKIVSGSELEFVFHNVSNIPKKIWITVSYMYKQEEQ